MTKVKKFFLKMSCEKKCLMLMFEKERTSGTWTLVIWIKVGFDQVGLKLNNFSVKVFSGSKLNKVKYFDMRKQCDK